MLDEVFKMCFPRRFLFFEFIFLPFFYFPVSIFEISSKTTKKKRKFPTLRYERIICVCVIASLCERIICVRSQHSLDIFHISRSGSRRRVFVFWLYLFYFYIEIKKVNWSIRYKLKQKKNLYILLCMF